MLRRGSPLSRALALALLGAVVLGVYVMVIRPIGTAYQGYQQSILAINLAIANPGLLDPSHMHKCLS